MDKEMIKHLTLGMDSFPYFVNNIYSLSFDKFIPGKHIDEWASDFQNNLSVAKLSARKHSKSTLSYAYVMWKILYSIGSYEILYLSYKQDLAAYHTKKIKDLITRNPYFDQLKDLTHTQTQSVMRYSYEVDHNGKPRDEKIVEPDGILSFKRGRHPDLVVCDDILADPASELDIKVLQKINRVFNEDVMSLPKEHGGELKVVGTAQHSEDLFFKLRDNPSVHWGMYPAIIDEKKEKVLWPEMFTYERLVSIRDNEIGEKAFSKEYQCSPVWSEDAYFKRTEIMEIVSDDLTALKLGTALKEDTEVVGGWDLGKKRHPSHLALFKVVSGTMIQIHDKWMDNWDYVDQVEYIKHCIADFRVDTLNYDATRGELETLQEEGKLPIELQPIIFKRTTKFALAAAFERRVKNKTIQLLNNSRTINQILIVNNDLQAIETPQGHGDSFMSIMMACGAIEKTVDVGVTSFDILGET